MSATSQYPDFTGLNFETVWAMFQETDKKFQETKEALDRLEKSQAKTEKLVARTTRDIGNLGNRMGDVIEHMVAAGAIEQFNALGFHFNRLSPNEIVIDPNTGQMIAEMDIVLENGEVVIIVEIKTKPGLSDINKHKQRLQIYRESRNRSNPNDNKKIYGAIASPVFKPEMHAAVLEAGFYTISQSGKAIVITVPEGFVPKAY